MAWTLTNPVGNSIACTTVPSGEDHGGDTIPTRAYSCTFPAASAGTYHATANFPGDSNYDAANSQPLAIVVAHVTPTISVTGAALSNVYRAPITFTAIISGVVGSTAPTGAITWHAALGANALACASNGGPTVNAFSTTYTCTVSVSAPGTYTAYISFAGDSNYLAIVASSPAASVTVGPATPTITFSTTPASPNLGDTLMITATVNPSPGGPLPTSTGGGVTWTLTGTSGATTCDGVPTAVFNVYTCTIVARTAGTYIAQAAFAADNDYYGITLPAPAITIAKNLPTVTILHSGSPAAGGVVAFNAVVTGVNTANDPTGSFTWTISGTANTSICVPTVASINVSHALTFTCTEQLPTVGTYVASGAYSGDNNYLPNTATAPDVVLINSVNPTFLPITLGQIANLKAATSVYAAVVPVTVSWDALAGADTYIVQVGTSLATVLPVSCASNTATTCVVNNLISGTTYYFWVNGYHNDLLAHAIGQGIFATKSLALPTYFPPPPAPAPTPPAPPPSGGLPTVTVPLPLAAPVLTGVGGDKQVTLSWSNVKDDNRTGYLLDYSIDGQTFSKAITLGATASSAVVTGLSNGVSTIFRLTPAGKAGSGVAAIASVSPGVPAQAPTALSAQSGDSQVSLNWNAPTDTGGLKINNYVVEQSTDGTNWTLASSTPGDTTQVNLQGLKNFTNYTFRVSAITNFGRGLSAVLATNAAALPSAPLALHIVSSASKTVTVGWQLPAGAPAGSISGFQVEQSLDGSAWITAQTASGSALSATLSGLINGSTYEIRVTPISGSGLGASTVILAAPGAAPDAVAALSATAGDKKVSLTFTPPSTNGGYSVDYYTVQIANSPTGPWSIAIPNTGSSLTKVDVPSLKNGTTYFFKVSAVNQIGTGQDSSVVSAAPQPSAPAPVIQTFVMTNTTAKITWIPAVGSNTRLLSKYLVEISPDGLKWSTAATLPLSVTTFTVNRLKTPLLTRVRAVSAVGPGIPTLGVRIPGTSGATITTPTPTPKKPTPTPTPTKKK